jgi:hypothetical protein
MKIPMPIIATLGKSLATSLTLQQHRMDPFMFPECYFAYEPLVKLFA